MPQMSPLNWLILYFYLMLVLLMVNVILNYVYMVINLKEEKKTNIVYKKFNWMW